MDVDALQRLLDESPVHRGLGLLAVATDGGVLLDAGPGPEHSVGGGAHLHGGVIATILDTAATFALIDATGSDWSTVDLRVDYLRPAPVAALRATGHAVHAGRQLGRARAELCEPETGRRLAEAVGTFVRND
jgi:uncharacterized protein (TIGR00369 family)